VIRPALITRLGLRRWRREGRLALVGLLLALAAGVGFWFQHAEGPAIVRLTLTAGNPEGTRQLLADALARAAEPRGLRFGMVQTTGSEEALDRIEAGLTDLALIQGGLRLEGRERVRLIAPLHVEPLHLLVKRELAAAATEDLRTLAGRTVNLGAEGSGTYCLAAAVLEFIGLGTAGAGPAAVQPTAMGYAALLAQTDRASLPDAVFSVSTLPSRVARVLVAERGYDLVPLPFGQAFRLSALTDPGLARLAMQDPGVRGAEAVLREHIDAATIPAYTYGVEPGVPERPLATLGARLLLVGRADLEPRSVERLLDALFESRFASVVTPPLTPDLLRVPPEIPRHAGTTAYLQRNQPLFTGDVLDQAEKWISIAAATAAGAWFLLGWYRRRERLRRDRGFEAYILKVDAVERQVSELERSLSIPLEKLYAAQRELERLKQEALTKFAAGDLEGEELFSGFLSQVSDVREFVTRLILHERDVIEDSARAAGRNPASYHDQTLRPIVGPDSVPKAPNAPPPRP
jgi:TRAP-type uncharacterized transport system substrate-binding protein